MKQDDIILEMEPNRPLVAPGIWLGTCVGYEEMVLWGKPRLQFLWSLDAGPYRSDLMRRWERGDSEWGSSDYDDPTEVCIPVFYPVRKVKGRLLSVGRKYQQDMWRYFDKPPRTDRMPTRSLVGGQAYISVRTVDTDYRGLECQPYSVVNAVVKPATASLSTEDL